MGHTKQHALIFDSTDDNQMHVFLSLNSSYISGTSINLRWEAHLSSDPDYSSFTFCRASLWFFSNNIIFQILPMQA